ncbi:hypothetical protein RB653_006420 [Dictyostelium firmibasis]|uniref:Rab GTPase n=1 Tax=Dictyostelium firmibasis TaxID=79012 RepID=A0AAN7UDD6_9MYCE
MNMSGKFFKTLVIGDTCVGKMKFIQGFLDENNKYILNNDSRYKIILNDGLKIKLLLTKYVDRPSCGGGGGSNTTVYKNTQCFIIIFDVCNLDSLHSVKLWIREIVKFSQEGTPIIVIGNKIDLHEKRQVENKEVIELIEQTIENLNLTISIPYFEISSIKPDHSLYDCIFKKVYTLSNQRFYIPLINFGNENEDEFYSDYNNNDEKKFKKEKRKSKSIKKIVSIFKK